MERLIATRRYDDGRDRWASAEAAPATALAEWVDRYAWWSEETASFTTRRELAGTTGVLILNLGSPLEIVDASGVCHVLRAGQGFTGGVAQATSLSRSTGAMEGVHVHLPPATLARLLRLPLAVLTDRCYALGDLIGDEADRLGEQLLLARGHEARWRVLDAFLSARAAAADDADR